MNITTLVLLPLMAYILNIRMKNVYISYKKNIEEKKLSEILLLMITVILIIALFIMSEIIMP